jgi:hypothetical protein
MLCWSMFGDYEYHWFIQEFEGFVGNLPRKCTIMILTFYKTVVI